MAEGSPKDGNGSKESDSSNEGGLWSGIKSLLFGDNESTTLRQELEEALDEYDEEEQDVTWMTPSDRSETVKVPVHLLLVPHFSAAPASDPVSAVQVEAVEHGAVVVPPDVLAEIFGELARYGGEEGLPSYVGEEGGE